MAAYANDLISYYLDSVLKELETSETASSRLLSSYDSYRKQRTPKPTYSQFADGLDIDADWWQNRLRLLQLLGGSQGAASKYDVSGILERVSQYEKELVPEMIILAGRQSQHNEAIRLLVHGLGDYDTAVTYCLRGGSSTYSPLSGSLPREATPSRQQQENLFRHLAQEFLRLDSEDDRLAQTSELLERFAPWFDPVEVSDMNDNINARADSFAGRAHDTRILVRRPGLRLHRDLPTTPDHRKERDRHHESPFEFSQPQHKCPAH